MTTQDAATIASGIDTSTVAGHNLRALLLRLLDGDPWRGEARAAARAATDRAAALGLLDIVHTCALTPLGREVAERLRPLPWRWRSYKAAGWGGALIECFEVETDARVLPMTLHRDDAERIAALLTADDLRAAKAYRVES
jgi:hypothetical protein